jgi:hypothetical protein
MSNTTTVDSYIATLGIIQLNIARYGYSIFCVTGNIGCILNILILTQCTYRQNSCSCYILAASFNNLIIMNLFPTLRFLIDFNVEGIKVSWFCKIIHAYGVQATSAISRIYVSLACIDRWAMTSRNVHIRAFAKMKVAKILIPSVPIIWCLMTLHVCFYEDNVKGKKHTFIRTLFFNSYFDRSMYFNIKDLYYFLQYLQYDF